MNFNQIVKNLEEEIKGNNRKERIEILEEILIKNIEELSKNENFFNLPLNNIFSIISKIDFHNIEENDKIIEIIQNIIKNIINKHFEEKETILILQNLNTKTISFSSYEEIFSLLELIRNCPILVNFCNLYKERNKSVDIDYEYEIQQKNKEIEELKQKQENISFKFLDITDKPDDFEPYIFKACTAGKLTSVQWLIERENEDKNKRAETPDYLGYIFVDETPIHIASKNGHLSIAQYLIEKQKVEKDIKGYKNWTPLHYACRGGHFLVAEYLISKGANIEATDDCGWTPLHLASFRGRTIVVQYLVSNEANKYSRALDGRTPYDLAKNDSIRNLLK